MFSYTQQQQQRQQVSLQRSLIIGIAITAAAISSGKSITNEPGTALQLALDTVSSASTNATVVNQPLIKRS